MSKRVALLIIFTICIGVNLTACKDVEKPSNSPVDVTESFFSAFETSDYEAMKAYCTEECIERFFHSGDVDGMVWAKLTECFEEEIIDDNTVAVPVSVEMETAETSALYPETETSFYVVLIHGDDDIWRINDFPTGL